MHRVSHGRGRREERAQAKWSEEWSEVIVEKDDNRRMRGLIRTRCVGLPCSVEQNTQPRTQTREEEEDGKNRRRAQIVRVNRSKAFSAGCVTWRQGR